MKRDVLAEVGLHRVAVLAGKHGPGPEVDCAGGAGHEAGCEDGGEGEEGGWPGLELCSTPSVPQPVVQSRRRPLLGPSPG